MPPKKIGFAAKRNRSLSSTRPRKQMSMKGYASGLRTMDKSAKILAGIFLGSNVKSKRYKSTTFRVERISNVNIDHNRVHNSDSNWKKIVGIIILLISVIIFIFAIVLCFQGSYFYAFFTFISVGFPLGIALALLEIDVR